MPTPTVDGEKDAPSTPMYTKGTMPLGRSNTPLQHCSKAQTIFLLHGSSTKATGTRVMRYAGSGVDSRNIWYSVSFISIVAEGHLLSGILTVGAGPVHHL